MEHGTKSAARTALGLSLAALVLVGAGCAAKSNLALNGGVNAPPSQADVNAGAGESARGPIGMMPAKKLQARLEALGGSGQTGNVEINEEAGKTVVVLTVVGEPKGAEEPAHIHLGSCPTPGDVKWSLSPVIDGKSTTTLDVSMDDLLAAGDISVNVHKSATDIATYMACGDLHLPSDQPGSMGAGVNAGGNVNVNAGDGAMKGGVDLNVNAGDGAMKGGVDLNVNAGGTMKDPVTIKLTAHQFAYEPSEVHVKLGQEVHLLIDDVDVQHGFALPAFNVNQKLTVGQTTEVVFTADQKGSFPFFCSVFCGSGHTGMRGTLVVE